MSNKRVYYIKRASFQRQSVAAEQHNEEMRAFWIGLGYEEVPYAEYKAFGEQHRGPRTVVVYLDDELNTKLTSALKRLKQGKHPNATLADLLESIIALYVKERLA